MVQIETLEKYYENYRKEWEKDQGKNFFNEHKNQQWFIEKYDPIVSHGIYKNTLEDVARMAKNFFESIEKRHFAGLSLEASDQILDMQKEQLTLSSMYLKKIMENILKMSMGRPKQPIKTYSVIHAPVLSLIADCAHLSF